MKKALKILRNIFLTIVGIIALILVLVNFSWFQTFLVRKATTYLSQKLNTKVEIKNLRIDLLNHILLEGLYIEDQQKDTLAYIGKAELRITDWFFVNPQTPTLHYLGLKDAKIHLYRKSNTSDWNYTFIEEAFAAPSTKKKKKSNASFEFDLKKILLDNVSVHYDDAWIGSDYDIDIGHFLVNVDELDFDKKNIDVAKLVFEESSIRMRDYKGGRPPRPKKAPTIDTTAFNPELWKMRIRNIDLDEVHFKFVSKTTAPYPNEFDPEYIDVSHISLLIEDAQLEADTLKGHIKHFKAQERCGLEIKEMQSKVYVSPIASICKELYLETNRSNLMDYYAMHYNRFPDFLDYIEKVKMDIRLKNSKVDPRDIAFFAPALQNFPVGICKIEGAAKGTVAHLTSDHLFISDGFSTLKGDFDIVGLPDIDKTIFTVNQAEIMTSGGSILKYAPMLKSNPNLNLDALDYAYFKGAFKGTLSDFKTKGSLTSNLGNLDLDVLMKLPEHQKPYYSGTVHSEVFDIGRLLNQNSLGKTSLQAQIEGNSFDAKGFNINAKTQIKDFVFNGYTYRNIIAEGLFDKNKFDGKLLMNDTNISLGFYGAIDFSDENIKVNATANLLSSDLKALHFVEVPTTLSADFDLNCSGKTIDDFIGSAKLYNINLLRHQQRMDLDSINILSYYDANVKRIDIESNLLSAKINGQYQLSALPNAMQYYLSNYLPNYISKPKTIASNQNVNFTIETHEVNELLRAFTLYGSGFDSSTFKGSFNTAAQNLNLQMQVPYGKIGAVKIYNSSLIGNGNVQNINIQSNIEKMVVADNLLNTSLNLDATVGNDSILYKIVTKSDEQIGTATISGNIVAENEQLIFAFNPSEFYLNNAKWNITGNNRIIYNSTNLEVYDFNLSSGLQQININTLKEASQPIVITAKNIDIAQFAALSDAAQYQPEGRINGMIKLENILSKPVINSNIEANDVKLFGQNVGMIKLVGNYNDAQKLIELDKLSGIYGENYQLDASAKISFDSNSTQPIDAMINISNFPLPLIAPLLEGYASNVDGLLKGNVSIQGAMANPTIEGKLNLKNTIAKVDYTGALYTIPDANILIHNKNIVLDNIQLYDVFQNQAIAKGSITLNQLNNPKFNIQLETDELELVQLKENENELFYGHVIGYARFGLTGSLKDMRMSITARPTQKSALYLPYNGAGDHSSNNTYIFFKTLGASQNTAALKPKDKLSVKITAVLNNFLDVALVLDPSTGDQITANGNGNLSIDVPANEDYSMFGTYNIDKGSYLFTFRQVIAKTFNINSGSTISFAGNIANTKLNVKATYPTNARLYDLLDANKAQLLSSKEEEDAKATQPVNVELQMLGTLSNPELNYQIELQEKRSLGTTAYAELNRINNSDKTALTNQVSALLLLGAFIPSQGISSTMAVTGAKNTMGDVLASQMSPLLSNALNKVLGDKNLQVMLQYKSFGQDAINSSQSGPAMSAETRNQIKFGLKKNYFNDRLSLQVGSAYDWGRPNSNNQNATNFNLAGDFRAQYLLSPDGNLSLVGFRSSNYDIFYGNNIARTGLGLTYRKSFDNFYEFIHSKKRVARELRENQKGVAP